MILLNGAKVKRRFGYPWILVFYHSAENNQYFNDDEIMGFRGTDKFSIFGLLSYSHRIRGKFEFLLEYSSTEYHWWRQTKNPWDEPFKKCTQARTDISSCPVDGFECLDCRLNVCWWGGLGRTDPNEASAFSYLDGSIGTSAWYFAIGSRKRWTPTTDIPGPSKNVKQVSLWMRSDNVHQSIKSKHRFVSISTLLFALLLNK